MNYGTWIISLAIINVVTAFSGLPTGTKKAVFVLTSLVLLAIGLILRAIEKRRAERIREKKEQVEELSREEIGEIADSVAHDVHESVEEDIESMTSAGTADE